MEGRRLVLVKMLNAYCVRIVYLLFINTENGILISRGIEGDRVLICDYIPCAIIKIKQRGIISIRRMGSDSRGFIYVLKNQTWRIQGPLSCNTTANEYS